MDGQNLDLNAKREQRLAARASVTQCISRHAETSLGASAEVYFNIRETKNGHWTSSEPYKHAKEFQSQTIWYAYPCAPGISLDLFAGAQYPGYNQTTTGTCNFGGKGY
jgi:hypothetical protein